MPTSMPAVSAAGRPIFSFCLPDESRAWPPWLHWMTPLSTTTNGMTASRNLHAARADLERRASGCELDVSAGRDGDLALPGARVGHDLDRAARGDADPRGAVLDDDLVVAARRRTLADRTLFGGADDDLQALDFDDPMAAARREIVGGLRGVARRRAAVVAARQAQPRVARLVGGRIDGRSLRPDEARHDGLVVEPLVVREHRLPAAVHRRHDAALVR